MKNYVFGLVAFAVLAVVANDSFAGCRSCGRSRASLGLRSKSCSSSCASSCNTVSKAPAAAAAPAPAAAPKPAAQAAAKVESSSCANGSCGSAGIIRGRLRLR